MVASINYSYSFLGPQIRTAKGGNIVLKN